MMRRRYYLWGVLGLMLTLSLATRADLNTSRPVPTQDLSTGSTGSAVPASAGYVGGNGSGNLTGIVACDSSTSLQMTTATTTQLVGLVSGKTIYVCQLLVNGAGSTTIKFVYGTGTACATGTTNLTQPFTVSSGTNVFMGSGIGSVFKTASGNALCSTNSAAATANIQIAYTQF